MKIDHDIYRDRFERDQKILDLVDVLYDQSNDTIPRKVSELDELSKLSRISKKILYAYDFSKDLPLNLSLYSLSFVYDEECITETDAILMFINNKPIAFSSSDITTRAFDFNYRKISAKSGHGIVFPDNITELELTELCLII